MAYEERFVAFIDILGFKNKVEQSVEKLKDFEKIEKSLFDIHSIKTSDSSLKSLKLMETPVGTNSADIVIETNTDSNERIRINIATFSDSIVISCSSNNQNETIQKTYGSPGADLLIDLSE